MFVMPRVDAGREYLGSRWNVGAVGKLICGNLVYIWVSGGFL